MRYRDAVVILLVAWLWAATILTVQLVRYECRPFVLYVLCFDRLTHQFIWQSTAPPLKK